MASVVVRTGQFRDLSHTVRVLSNLNEQRASSRFCDVVLRINNEQIFAHSNVLAAASPYFGSFLGLGQDSPRAFCQKNPQIIEIHIDSTEGDSGYGEAVRHVVEFMYTCSIELNNKIITQVVEIARIMQLQRVLEFCDRFQKGETGNLPLNKGTGMPVIMPEISFSRKLRKANAATETELTMFQKSAGFPVDLNVSLSAGFPENVTQALQLPAETGQTGFNVSDPSANCLTARPDSENINNAAFCAPLTTGVLSITETDGKGECPLGIAVSLGQENIPADERKPDFVSVDYLNAGGPICVKDEGHTHSDSVLPVPCLTQTADSDQNSSLPGDTKEGLLMPSEAITVVPPPIPQTLAPKQPATRGRKPKRGRRGRKRKAREVLSDSDTELMQDLGEEGQAVADVQTQVSLESLDVSDKGEADEEDVKDSTISELDTSLSASTSTTDLTSVACGEVEGLEVKQEPNQPPASRTRGRKPITSVMASWSSPRRRAGIPRSVFKSDYVMHSLVRRTRQSGNVSHSSLLPSGNSDDEELETLENCEALTKSANIPGSLGMESTLKFVCQTCDFTTASFRLYRQHMKRHPETDTRSYTCTECNFHTTKARDLLQHRKRHLHEELICSFCEVQLDTAENFQLHLQQHAHSLPYFCHSCDMRFKTRTQLSTHLPKHMTEKPFVCQVCGNGFKWKHALKNHMVTHSTTKDHLCDICGFATAHKSQLKAHRLIHTGDTFKCPEPGCHFEATKRQNLKYHMVTHTQEKAHQCEVDGSFLLKLVSLPK